MKFTEVTSFFYRVEDIFSNEELDYFDKQFGNYKDWIKMNWRDSGIRFSTPLSHKVDDFAKTFAPVVELMERKYQCKMICNGGVMWADMPGLVVPKHVDETRFLRASFQVYLGKGPDNLGTSIYVGNEVYSVPYVRNTGYVILFPSVIEHGTLNAVPTDVVRKSVHLSWREDKDTLDWGPSGSPYYS